MIKSFYGTTADEVWQSIVDVFKQSDGTLKQASRLGTMQELLHVVLTIEDPRQRWIVSREPPLNMAFALAEIVWILRGRRDLAFLSFWNKNLRKYVGPGPQLNGAYGHRIRNRLGFDQLIRVYKAIKHNNDTRQAVLQIWDSRTDIPKPDGSPADPDIPCNVVSMPKLRNGKLEWMQVIRSNDMFLGTPHNIVQFTCMQEVLAGWLGVECGSYNQVSDSLHVYDRDMDNVLGSQPMVGTARNLDSLALPWKESELVFKELESRIEQMINPRTTIDTISSLSNWNVAPQAYRNIAKVLVAYALRQRNRSHTADQVMASCSNPVYIQLWNRWCLSRRRNRTSLL